MPILEAFDNCCPVLLADRSCFPEIGGSAAFYFDGASEESLMHAMDCLWDDSGERLRLIRLGQERGRQFSWQKAAEETAAVYRSLGRGASSGR